MFAQLTNKIVYNQLSHYVSIAQCMGRIHNHRDALKELIDLIGSKQGESVLFFHREDSRYFVAEFDGVRLMTVYEDSHGDLAVEAHDKLPESGASIIIEMLGKAIQIKTLEWHVQGIDRYVEASQRGLNMVNNLGKVLNGAPTVLASGNNSNQGYMAPPVGPRI